MANSKEYIYVPRYARQFYEAKKKTSKGIQIQRKYIENAPEYSYERVKIDPTCTQHKKYPVHSCGYRYIPTLGCLFCKRYNSNQLCQSMKMKYQK